MMKRFFKLALLTLVIGLFSQNTQAQTITESGDKPDVAARAELADLDKALDLSDEQERTLFRAIMKREVEYRKSVQGKDMSNPNVSYTANKLKENFENELKAALTEKQFKKWQRMQ